jgi:sugar phosphate isomerase/epimerase
MNLGILAHYSPSILDYCEEQGYTSVALSASPSSPIDAESISDSDIRTIRKDFEKHNLKISTLGFYPNHLNGFFKRTGDEKFDLTRGIDFAGREKIATYFKALIRLAARMDVRLVSTHGGFLPGRTLDEMVDEFRLVFTPYAEVAEKEGVRIALENCPHGPGGGNFIHSPDTWDRVFSAVPSKNLGIEFDPSHMIILFMDYLAAIEAYGSRIYHVHLKDAEILPHIMNRTGVRNDESWWRYRLPGWGSVDWKRFFSALHTIGYDGDVVVENEDAFFEGTDVAWTDPRVLSPGRRTAFAMAYHYLRPLIF